MKKRHTSNYLTTTTTTTHSLTHPPIYSILFFPTSTTPAMLPYYINIIYTFAAVLRNSVRAAPAPTPVLSPSPPTEISTEGRMAAQAASALCTG